MLLYFLAYHTEFDKNQKRFVYYHGHELPCLAFLFGSNMRREILFIEVIILTVIMHTELEFSLIILCNVSIGDFVDSFL